MFGRNRNGTVLKGPSHKTEHMGIKKKKKLKKERKIESHEGETTAAITRRIAHQELKLIEPSESHNKKA